MKAQPPCVPCILSRVLRLAEIVTDDPWLHNRILSEMMEFLRRRTPDSTPAELMTEVALRACKILGLTDPYASKKATWQEELMAGEDKLRGKLAEAQRPLELAVKFSCIANSLENDLAKEVDLAELFEEAEKLRLCSEVWEDFRREIKTARKIVFVHAAAGEIFVDKLLIERLGKKEVVSAVRDRPILSWATEKEALEVGLDKAVSKIIKLGTDALGLPLSQCSQELREEVESSDLVIAKGQACWETLSAEKKGAYVLFRVKCEVMAGVLGLSVGDLVLEKVE